ncbi:hypothetical protein CYY_003864 [Polysphondylium violaceum]|uniref:Uncharacterized protein n=1 Tax=Polysphondylium violaceum TaxID=133409 RepID=A0A8J4PU46_9MYCE|nr:hypothetical protein CYY_003864 [Polysphondylium violaceum]
MSSTSTPVKGKTGESIIDKLVDKLTPNKKQPVKNNANNSNNSNNSTTTTLPPLDTTTTTTTTTKTKTTITSSSSSSAIASFVNSPQTPQHTSSPSPSFDAGASGGGGSNSGYSTPQKQQLQQDDHEKYLTLSPDSVVVINKDKLDSHYINSIESQISLLNKQQSKKEKPKRSSFKKQVSFNNKLFIDASSINSNEDHQPVNTSSNQFINHTSKSNHVNNNNNNNTPTSTTSSSSPTPTIAQINHQITPGGDEQEQQQQDPNALPFSIQDIPISCRLYIDHLKTENYELKRQLNIVLNDNAEQWEQSIHLQDIINQLEEYTDQQDQWVTELRSELINSTELLLNHHQKIDNLSDILYGIGEQKESFQTLYEQSQAELSKVDEDNQRLTLELQDYKELTNGLDKHIVDMNKELRHLKDHTIETILWRIKNQEEPSGIEAVKSFGGKEQLLLQALKYYQYDYQEEPLLTVIMYLKNTLHWKIFIQILRNQFECLDYYIKYCKLLNRYDDLRLIYRDTHNSLEEGLVMVKQAMLEKDVNLQLCELHTCVAFFDNHDHLHFYKHTLMKCIESLKNGINFTVPFDLLNPQQPSHRSNILAQSLPITR